MSDQPGWRAWLIVAGLAFSPAVGNGIGRFAYGLILPAMREDLAWNYAQAGWINTSNAIGYLAGAVLAFAVISRIGPRHLVAGGLVLTVLTLLACGLTRDYWALTFWRVLTGIGGAPAFIAGGAVVSTLFRDDPSRSSLAIAIYFGGGGAGMLLSGSTIPVMLEAMGAGAWPQMWLLLAGMSAVGTVLCVLALAGATKADVSALRLRGGTLPIRSMVAALAAYFLFAVGYIVYVTFLVAWMQTQGATASLVAATWSLIGIFVMLSPFLWRGVLVRSRGGGALALACAACGVGTLLPLVVDGAAGLILSAAVFGLSFFIVPSAMTAFGRKNLPETQWGRSLALFTTCFAVGQVLGPVTAGWIADAFDSIGLGLAAAGLTLLVAGAVALGQRPLAQPAERESAGAYPH